MSHYALTDCPLRTVVELPQSKIGYTYPRIFMEAKFRETYYNFDLILGATFKMKESAFEDWWSDAIPRQSEEMCKEMGINFEAFKALVNGVNDLAHW